MLRPAAQEDPEYFSWSGSVEVQKSLMPMLSQLIVGNNTGKAPQHKMCALMEKIMDQQRHRSHPLTQLYKAFRGWFVEQYSACFDRESMHQATTVKDRCDSLVRHLQTFIGVMTQGVVEFYQMQDISDIEHDIVQMYVTRKLVRGSVYNIVINLMTAANEDEVLRIMAAMSANKDIELPSLRISPIFTLDKTVREKYALVRSRRKSCDGAELGEDLASKDAVLARLVDEYDYHEAINYLLQLKQTECPEEKINTLCALNASILNEIEAFWNGYSIQPSELKIDHDNLLSIYIYIVIKSQYAKLWVDYMYTQAFLTDSARMSNRGYFMANLGVALESIMNGTIGTAKATQELKEKAMGCMVTNEDLYRSPESGKEPQYETYEEGSGEPEKGESGLKQRSRTFSADHEATPQTQDNSGVPGTLQSRNKLLI